MKMTWCALALVAVSASAQVTIEFAPFDKTEKKDEQPHAKSVPHRSCCGPIVVDANGKTLGEVIKYDERFQSIPLNAWVRYEVQGDAVALNVGPESINSPVGGGGSNIVFTSNDCSGDAFLAGMQYPTLTKRYAVVLTVGGINPGPWAATNAWLYATDPLPARVDLSGMVFHSQWDYTNSCTAYPAPGLTFSGTTWAFKAHKIEDLYAKFKRPFYVP
jgi:hypothetical protein